jgi:hypothetical protein
MVRFGLMVNLDYGRDEGHNLIYGDGEEGVGMVVNLIWGERCGGVCEGGCAGRGGTVELFGLRMEARWQN